MQDTVKHPEINIEHEMKKSYLEYAMSVIIGRALPDVRDGLKPVHRRVLYAMRELRNDWNKPYKKSARIVGDVIGKYHPHGDSAVYDTIVRMAQDFSLRYMLVDGQGNFGSVDGDSAAAMRYTEIRMKRLSHQMLEDLEKETVDFVPNYDESLNEPSVLPSKFPNLLVNGSSGIAVGMATNIPPHNLIEVSNAIIALIDNPELTSLDFLEHIPGPDFPTGGFIYGTQGIIDAYNTGRGIIRVRAKIDVEEDRKTGAETIAVTELPYQVNKARLVEKIAQLVRHKVIEGISYCRDESDRDGMRIALGVKRGHLSGAVINQLYKHTQMQNTFGIIFLAVVDNQPKLLTLKEILEHFILHRKEVITRRTQYELNKAEARAHILEGLKIALDNLDDVVALVRESKSPAEAKEGLILKYKLSDIQAQAILDMRLQRLTGLERDKIIEEYENILREIARYRDILGSERIVLDMIKNDLEEIKAEFGDERRTEIVESTADISIEDMITEEDMVVTISRKGYIKRNPIVLYNAQKRGGKGKTAMSTKDEDFVEHVFVASTHHYFLFLTNLGRVYWSKVYELPLAGRTSIGKAIVNLLNFEENEKLSTILAVPKFEEDKEIIMATKKGIVKKSKLMDYSRPRQGGIKAIVLSEGDELISARITDGTMNVLLSTSTGKSIRFSEEQVRSTGRVAKGVKGINLAPSDFIVSMEVENHGTAVLVMTENGYGKRTLVEGYRKQSRAGKGIITIKTSERNGNVVSSMLVNDDDEIMIVTDGGKLIRMRVDSISIISRNTQGVRLINLDKNEKVIGAARLPEVDDDDMDTDAELVDIDDSSDVDSSDVDSSDVDSADVDSADDDSADDDSADDADAEDSEE